MSDPATTLPPSAPGQVNWADLPPVGSVLFDANSSLFRSSGTTNPTEHAEQPRHDVPSHPKPDRNDPEDRLNKAYHDHALVEDELLVKKYSDDISGLLTFAGLLSAIITAFLLVEQTDFRIQSSSTTNVLLYNIYLQVERSNQGPVNGTHIGHLERDQFLLTKEEELETDVVALYYASLTVSLLSAFGALLSKQWIMHYNSLPPWADTVTRMSKLRRMRHQSLGSWGFYIVMENIPLLIQISLLLFSVGVLQSVRPHGKVWTTMLAFIVVGMAFWVGTLLLGAFASSSPFKSPTSNALVLFSFNIYLQLVRLAEWVSWISKSEMSPSYLSGGKLLDKWNALKLRDSFMQLMSESFCLDDEAVSAGIRWWGLRRRLPWQDNSPLTDADQQAAAYRLVRRDLEKTRDDLRHARPNSLEQTHAVQVQKHAEVVRKIVGDDPLLLDWGGATLERLEQPTLSCPEDLSIQIETLCYFVYHVPAATGFLLDTRLCGAVRLSQGVSDDRPLDVLSLTNATIATYFRGFLYPGSTKASSNSELPQGANQPRTPPTPGVTYAWLSGPAITENHEEWIELGLRNSLCKEITTVLKNNYITLYSKACSSTDLPSRLRQQCTEDTIATITLASTVMVLESEIEAGSPFKRTPLVHCQPYEQLNRALNRLALVTKATLLDDDLCELMVTILLEVATLLSDHLPNRTLAKSLDPKRGSFQKLLDRVLKMLTDHRGRPMTTLREKVALLQPELEKNEQSHLIQDLRDRLLDLVNWEQTAENKRRSTPSGTQTPQDNGFHIRSTSRTGTVEMEMQSTAGDLH